MNTEKEKQEKLKWYDSGNIINNSIIGIILLIIICSQSFAVSSSGSLSLFGSVINHNSIYLLVLIYCVFLKTKFGKKYFNYLNVFLIFVYFIATITSFLTVIQSFSLNTVLSFTINFVLVVYMIHTFFRDTRYWKEFRLNNSPFNEFSNDSYFYSVIVVSIFLLAVNLISTVAVSGVILSMLDAIYLVLFGRFIYLYRYYLDSNNKDTDNAGNFDEIRESIKNTFDDTSNKVKDLLDEANINKTIDGIKEATTEVVDNVKTQINVVVNDEKKKEDVSKKTDDNKKQQSNKKNYKNKNYSKNNKVKGDDK